MHGPTVRVDMQGQLYTWCNDRPLARIDFGVGVQNPKSRLFEPNPCNCTYKTQFLTDFVA